MSAQYKIVDTYEGWDTVGYAETLTEARELAREYDRDTDGENCLMYYPLNPLTGKYTRAEAQPLYF